ncbi:transmembrane protein 109-like [Erpetoichthys calabaricus]|uniref:transmembrane protein 109-like n=1 Tax=Erpetoichthys calabaricus TaxID=27687 RepID=UPI0022340B47|nr:transmembrane protein 109-like [Erpetoichthys calabaricus]
MNQRHWLLYLLQLFLLPASLAQQYTSETKKTTTFPWFREFIGDVLEKGRNGLESLLGREVVDTCLEVIHNGIVLVSGTVATGLNLLVVLIKDLLLAMGLDVQSILPSSQPFTQHEVATIMAWALMALIIYYFLAAVLRRVLWLLQMAAFCLAFFFILQRVEDPYNKAALLLVLVTLAVLLGGAATSSSQINTAKLQREIEKLEHKVGNLSSKLKSY